MPTSSSVKGEAIAPLSTRDTSEICHDSAAALNKLGDALPPPVGPIAEAVGAIVEVACDIYDAVKANEPSSCETPTTEAAGGVS